MSNIETGLILLVVFACNIEYDMIYYESEYIVR